MASGPTGRPATIYDVAARAKLSIATVSRVLQGTGPVSAKARARVDQAAQELNYVPLRAARSLAVHQDGDDVTTWWRAPGTRRTGGAEGDGRVVPVSRMVLGAPQNPAWTARPRPHSRRPGRKRANCDRSS